jgi:hypothetical protein
MVQTGEVPQHRGAGGAGGAGGGQGTPHRITVWSRLPVARTFPLGEDATEITCARVGVPGYLGLGDELTGASASDDAQSWDHVETVHLG